MHRYLAILLFFIFTSVLLASPQQILYQGEIELSGSSFSGNISMKFVLHNGSGALWSNDGTGDMATEPTQAVEVYVDQGLYSVALGDSSSSNMTSLNSAVLGQSQLQLRVWVDDGSGTYQLMSPDKNFYAVPFAQSVVDGHIENSSANLSALSVGSLTFPTTTGSANQALITDGFGNLTWSDQSSVSSNVEISMVRLDTTNGYGSTATMIRRFSNVVDEFGSAINYTDSATDGASFIAQADGVYSIVYSDSFGSQSWLGISVNSNELTTEIGNLTDSSDRLVMSTKTNNNIHSPLEVTWIGFLNAGDVVRPHSEGIDSSTSPSLSSWTMTYHGQLSSGNAISSASYNSLSETSGTLSATGNLVVGGSTNLNGLLFPTTTGSGNQVLTTDGFGYLAWSDSSSVNSNYDSLTETSGTLSATGNLEVTGSSNLGGLLFPTTTGSANQVLTTDGFGNLSWSDSSSVNSNSSSLANTSYVRVHTGNGSGSVDVAVRRFSTISDNLGSAITYTDSATNGGTFLINEDGVYHITYIDSNNVTNNFGVSRNSNELTINIDSINVEHRLALFRRTVANHAGTVSWSGILNAGDVIRGHQAAAVVEGVDPTRVMFTIVKIGADLAGSSNTSLEGVSTTSGTTAVSGNLNVIGSTNLGGLVFPTISGSANQVLASDGSGQLVWSELNSSSSSSSNLLATGWEDITAEANSSYLPSNVGTANGVYNFYRYRRVGDTLEITFKYSSSLAGSGTSFVVFPFPGYDPVDTVVKTAGISMTYNVSHTDPATTNYVTSPVALASTPSAGFKVIRVGESNGIRGQDLLASSQIHVQFSYQVSGWSAEFSDVSSLSSGNLTSLSGNITTQGNLIVTGSTNLNGLLFPSSTGSANQVLTTDSLGNLTWETVSAVSQGNAIAFKATRDGSNPAITANSATLVDFATLEFDNTGDLNAAGNRFTPTTAGVYLLNATTTLSGMADGTSVGVVIYKNGSEIARGSRVAVGLTSSTTSVVSTIVDSPANGDYYEVYVIQSDTDGGNESYTAGSSFHQFSGVLLAPSTITSGGNVENLISSNGNLIASGNFDVTGGLLVAGSTNLAGLLFPSSTGSANQVLSTDGLGNLSWESIVSSGANVENFSSSNGNLVSSGNFQVTGDSAFTGNLVLNDVLYIGANPTDTSKNLNIEDTSGQASLRIAGTASGMSATVQLAETDDAEFWQLAKRDSGGVNPSVFRLSYNDGISSTGHWFEMQTNGFLSLGNSVSATSRLHLGQESDVKSEGLQIENSGSNSWYLWNNNQNELTFTNESTNLIRFDVGGNFIVNGSANLENGLILGDTSSNTLGSIRFTGTQFQAYDGNNWLNLLSGSSSTLTSQDAESFGSTSSFTTASNSTFGGNGSFNSTFSLSTTASDLINGSQVYKLVLNAGANVSQDDFVASQTIDIPLGYRGRLLGLKFQYKYDGGDGGIRWVARDVTNNSILTLGSETLEAYNNNDTAREFILPFFCPASCDQVLVGPQVVSHAGGETLIWDDVELMHSPVQEITGQVSQEITHEAATSTMVSLSGDIRFDLSNLNSTGSKIVSFTDSGSATEFTALKECTVYLNAVVSIATAGWDLSVFRNGIRVTYGLRTTNGAKANVTSLLKCSAGDVIKFNTGNSIPSAADPFYLNLVATADSDQIVASTVNGENSMVRVHTSNGLASTDTIGRRFTTISDNIGSAIDYTQTASNGSVFTINDDGIYHINYVDAYNAQETFGISLNSVNLTTNIFNITNADEVLAIGLSAGANSPGQISWSGVLSKGDVVRPHGAVGATDSSLPRHASFTITKIGQHSLVGLPLPLSVYLKDYKSSGTVGGGFTSGAWQTRDLNTVEGAIHIVSLTSNQFTLGAGSYEIEFSAPGHRVDAHKAVLYNVTDSSFEIIGASAKSDTPDTTNSSSEGMGAITITESKTFEIQHRCSGTNATNGFGPATAYGVDELYTTVKITKIR